MTISIGYDCKRRPIKANTGPQIDKGPFQLIT